jgi:hypothetical protein
MINFLDSLEVIGKRAVKGSPFCHESHDFLNYASLLNAKFGTDSHVRAINEIVGCSSLSEVYLSDSVELI